MAFGVLAAAVLYCFYGGAPTQVSGTGFLLGPSGLDQVATPDDGTVVEVPIGAGQLIRAGQVIAVIRQPGGRTLTVRSQIDGEALITLVSPGDVVERGRPLVEVLPSPSIFFQDMIGARLQIVDQDGQVAHAAARSDSTQALRGSQAQVIRFRHNDAADLEKAKSWLAEGL